MANEWGDEEANEWGDLPADAPEPAPAPEGPGLGEAIARGIGRGGLFRLNDEYVGAARALGPQDPPDFSNESPIVEPVPGATFAERYRTARKEERDKDAAAIKANPVASFVSEAIGGAMTGSRVPAAGPVVGAMSVPARIGQGAASAAPVGAVYGFGGSEAETLPGMALDTGVGTVGAGLVGGAVPAAGAALAPVGRFVASKADDLATWLRNFAGERNIKAAGGIQSDITRARRQMGAGGVNNGRAELTEIGAEMGDKGLVGATSTPAKTFDKAAALMDDAGTRMGQILDAADASGAPKPGVQVLYAAGDDILAGLQSNPHTAAGVATEHLAQGHGGGHSAADMFAGLLSKYRRIYGDGPITFRQLHEIRKNISDDLYGLRGNKDPWADAYKSALHDLRSAVSQEIDQSLDAATAASPAWRAANRDYQVGAKALEFADKGMDRATGNNFVSPTEFLAGLTGAGVGSGYGGAGMTLGGLAAAGGVALARRHGSGAMGSAALGASKALRSAGQASPEAIPGTPIALTPAMLEWLRAKYGLAPAMVGAEEGSSP